MKLKIANDLSLPLDFITCTQAILAIKRVGKSYTASVQAEELLKAGQQIVAIDVTGAWYGLRSNATGDGPGFPVVIFGGDHGDIALEEGAGEVLAEAIVTERFSAIIDLSLFRKAQAQRFLAVFFETLYRKNREAMHIFMDEADFYAPQKPFGEEARTLGAVNDIVRRGGIRGIGCTLITQRASVLNKDVLTQAGIVTALRISHPRDMAAILEWVDVHSSRKDAQAMMAALPSLPIGTAYIWAPGWPTEKGIFQQIHVRQRETFNSGATPKAGHVAKQPKILASVDLKALGEQMAATVQRQKDNDPKELKAKIRQLEQAAKSSAPVVDDQAIQRAVQQALTHRDREWESAVGNFRANLEQALKTSAQTTFHVPPKPANAPLSPALTKSTMPPIMTDRSMPRGQIDVIDRRGRRTVAVNISSNGHSELNGPQQRILNACAWLESIGVKQPKQAAVAFLAGYTVGGGAFNNPRGALRQAGYIEYCSGDSMRLTDAGRTLAVVPEESLSTAQLQASVLQQLPGPEQKILQALLEAYPESVENDELARKAGYEPGGGAYNNPRGRLKSLGLISYPERGMVRAEDLLFV